MADAAKEKHHAFNKEEEVVKRQTGQHFGWNFSEQIITAFGTQAREGKACKESSDLVNEGNFQIVEQDFVHYSGVETAIPLENEMQEGKSPESIFGSKAIHLL